jgi:hypothetical protein
MRTGAEIAASSIRSILAAPAGAESRRRAMTDTEIANDAEIATDRDRSPHRLHQGRGPRPFTTRTARSSDRSTISWPTQVAGKVEYAVLQFGGVFGLGSDYYPLPWEKLSYDVEQGGYVVDIDKETLEAAPRYTAEEQPAYDQAYGERVYGYYGLTYS